MRETEENINIVLELEKVITTVSKKLRRLGINMVGMRDAAVDAERRLGSVSSNGGKIVYDMVLINTGKKEIEGKTIGEAWNLLKRKTDGQIH